MALAAGAGLTGISALPVSAEPRPIVVAAGLQVNIVPPGIVSGDSTIPLDVKFHGGNIRVIELFVDGVRLTRHTLSTRDGRGVVHFTLEPSMLSDGSHEILIKAYEADGTCATSTTQLVVSAGDLNAFAHLTSPRRNAEIQGVVPITVQIDPSISDPYVTYTVDNDFLALRNYAPYVYNWDTAKIGNGIHTIGIMVMDGRTLQVVQKLNIAINVKNAGGFTKRETPPGAAGSTKVETDSIANAIKSAAESVLPDTSLAPRDSVTLLARSAAHFAQPRSRNSGLIPSLRSNSTARAVVPNPTGGFPLSSLPASAMPSDSGPFAASNVPLKHGPASSGGSAAVAASVYPLKSASEAHHTAPGLEALLAQPSADVPSAQPSTALARQAVHFRRAGGIALRPGVERRIARGPAAPAARPAANANPRKTFDVVFDNSLINFDVPPRIENGLPLAPFRAIFEHTGGTVKWYNEAKTVRAFDNDREIEIKIGSKDAKVNNLPISMEATPYLDHGRTIVPLSFVRDAMDLKVTFDADSGHLLIEKK